MSQIKLDIMKAFVAACEGSDRSFTFDGPRVATVKTAEGAYKKKTVSAGEFFLEKAYLGKKGNVIVELFPEDLTSLEWASIEITDKDLDSCFPMMLNHLQHWALDHFKGKEVEDQTLLKDCVLAAPTVPLLLDTLSDCVTLATETKEQMEVEDMSALPTFGMF